jgi:hypothetical protein
MISWVPLVVLAGVAVGGDDPAKAKLDKAKETYKAAREKNREAVIEATKKLEESARKAGKFELVERIKSALDAYQKDGPLPPGLSATVKQRLLSARSAMDTAYANAVKEYLKEKKDDRVAETRKEWETFKLDISDDPAVVRLLNRTSAKYATIPRGAIVPKAGAEPRLLQNDPIEGTTQYFRIVTVGKTGLFNLQTLDGKYYVSTEAGGVGNGSPLTIADQRTGAAAGTQQWGMLPTSDGWGRLVHKASNKVVSVLDRSTANGGRLVIWSNEKTPTQEWKFD